MRKTLVLAMFALMLAAPASMAMTGGGEWIGGGQAGAHIPNGDYGDFFKTGFEGGVFLDYMVSNMFALGADLAGEHDVEQEGGHAQEDRRRDHRHAAQPAQLGGEEAVGQLVAAAVGAEPAVRRREPVEAVEDVSWSGLVELRDRDLSADEAQLLEAPEMLKDVLRALSAHGSGDVARALLARGDRAED